MKRVFLAFAICAALMIVPMTATADKVTGSIQGLICVTSGTLCPVGKEDPVAAAEDVFVLLVDLPSKDYYYLPNVPRSVLVRHLNEQVTVEGNVDKNTRIINNVTAMYAGERKVWSPDIQKDIHRQLWPSGP